MGAPYKLAIGISIDPAAAKAGGAQAQQAITGIKNAATVADSELQKLIATSTGLHSGAANENTRRWTGALADEALAVDNLRAKYNPLYAAVRQYQQAKTEIRTANAMGALSTEEMTAALQRERQATLATIDAIKGRNSALANLKLGNNLDNFQAANVAFQLQDIFSTSALGASPFTVALQQGPQLASVFGNMGAAGAVKTLGSAFASLATPVSLATIGLTAATSAAIGYFSSLSSEGDKANEVLDKQNDLIKQVAQRWGDAVPNLRAYVEELNRAKDTGDLREAANAVADQQWKNARTEVANLDYELSVLTQDLRQAGTEDSAILNIQNAFKQLKTAVNEGRNDTSAYRAVSDALAAAMQDQHIPAIDSFIARVMKLASVFTLAAQESAKFRKEGFAASGGDNVQDILSGSTFTTGGKTYQTGEFTPQVGPLPDRRPNIELEGLPGWQKQEKSAQSTANAYRDLIKSADDRVEQMKLEAELAGQTGVAADTLRFKLDLLQQSEDKGRSLSAKQVEAINQRVEAFKRYAEEASRAKLQSDLLFDRDQLGRSAADQEIASTLRGAGLPIDFDSYEAGLIRTNLQLQQARDLAGGFVDTFFGGLEQGESVWKSFGDAGLSVLKRLGDSLVNDVLNNIFSINNASSGGGGSLFGSLLGGLFGGGSSSSPKFNWASSGDFDFDRGGYTGPGGIHEPRGVVHAGEVVWSQRDVTRAGGVATVEAMRLGRRGYAAGGAVDVQPFIPGSRRGALSAAPATPSTFLFKSEITVSGNGDRELMENLRLATAEQMRQGFDQFSRSVLPGRMAEIQEDPFAVG